MINSVEEVIRIDEEKVRDRQKKNRKKRCTGESSSRRARTAAGRFARRPAVSGPRRDPRRLPDRPLVGRRRDAGGPRFGVGRPARSAEEVGVVKLVALPVEEGRQTIRLHGSAQKGLTVEQQKAVALFASWRDSVERM